MRILLIEDDKTTSRVMTMVLREHGMVCNVAADGAAGIAAARVGKYDAVLLDIILPDMDGLAVLKIIKSQDASVPVLMLSGIHNAQDKAACLNAGADDFIQKPVHKVELIARINAVSRRASCLTHSVAKVGQLSIDFAKRIVYNDSGVILDLTEKEYCLVELMVRKRGSVINKSYLINHMYSSEDQPESKIIDVFMCKIRCKLNKLVGDSRDYIKTYWGRGYMFDYKKLEKGSNLQEKVV